MDLEDLQNLLEIKADLVPFVMITVTNNAVGGLPVSMENLMRTREICDAFNKKLYIDSCRIAENAMFIKQEEVGYKEKSVARIIREMLSHAHGMTMSAKKDGLSHIGGWIALHDDILAKDLELNLTITEGFRTYGGLAGRDLEAVAIGLEEVVNEKYLSHRIGQVATLGRMLEEIGIPVVRPFGGHAVFVDVTKLLPDLGQDQFPSDALAVALYLQSGIRTMGMGRLFHGDDYRGPEILRIAIPRRVYDTDHLLYVQDSFAALLHKRQGIQGLKILKQGSSMRHFNAELGYV